MKQVYVVIRIVSFAAVIRVVTLSGGEALRDDFNNGCEGDYDSEGLRLQNLRLSS